MNSESRLWLIGLAVVAFSFDGYGQGTVYFNNYVPDPSGGPPLVDAPVINCLTGKRLEGAEASAALFVGLEGSSEASLASFGPAVPFLTGQRAGYIDTGDSPVRTIPGVAPGENAVVQMRVWYNNDPSGMLGRTRSDVVRIVVGGNGRPPTPIIGLQTLWIAVPIGPPSCVPEPASLGLMILAALALIALIHRPTRCSS